MHNYHPIPHCADCAQCKMHKGIVRCVKDHWTLGSGKQKTIRYLSPTGILFGEKSRRSPVYQAKAANCPDFDSMDK